MSQLKQRLPSTKPPSPPSASDSDDDPNTNTNTNVSYGPSMTQRALESTAHLANLLPTGTFLAFQILTPLFTNSGQCDPTTQTLTLLLLTVLSLSCFAASFSDSYRAADGRVYYGVATPTGMYLLDYVSDGSGPAPDLKKYRIGLIDWIHAGLSVMVFGVVVSRERNVVGCFYPDPTRAMQQVLDILPVGVGLICSMLFVAFPTRRHGIGYPLTSPSN